MAARKAKAKKHGNGDPSQSDTPAARSKGPRAKSSKPKAKAAGPQTASENKGKNRGGIENLRLFKPGQSGNPGGRPKVDKTVKALAREHTEDAVRTLAEILKNGAASESSRVQAASALLDRGWGRPLQQLEIGEAGAFSEMDEEAVDAFIASATLKLKDAHVAGHA